MEENVNVSLNEEVKPMTFNKDYLKRTIWIGLAFFGILLVWQLYNSYCSPMLSFLFARSTYPENLQNAEIAYDAAKAFWESSSDSVRATYANKEWIDPNTGLNWLFGENGALGFNMKSILRAGYITSDDYLDVQWKVGIIMALDNIAALFIMPIFGSLSDKTRTKLGKRMPYIIIGSVITAIALPFIPLFFAKGMASFDAELTGFVVGMIATMIVIIVFMMSYRSPAVALMPDLTPKPLRSKANGVINIVGYVGGAFGAIFAMAIPVTSYIDGSNRSLWMLEIPFIVCSVVLLISLLLLLKKVKENELAAKLREDIERGDAMGESAEQVTTTGKLSKTNIRNLALILVAEIFWFMSLNAVETFQTNYFMFWLNTSSAGGAIMTLVSGVASVAGFLLAGMLADKIGRKWTIFTGICTVALCYVLYSLIPTSKTQGTFDASFPWYFLVLVPIIGFGSSLIHICSFPLVTDYCTAEKLGKFTSLYYTASMLAQSVTPILIGLIWKAPNAQWNALPIYSAILMGIAGLVFFFVKAPRRNDTGENAKGLAALGDD